MIRAIDLPQKQLPVWVKQPKWARGSSTRGNVATAANMTFSAGASLAMLDALLLQKDAPVPMALLGNKLALETAEASLKLEGRFSSISSIRDAYHLTPPDSVGVYHWGPDGDSLSFWRQAVSLRINSQTGIDKLKILVGSSWTETIDTLIEKGDSDATESGPLVAASNTVKRVLDADDRSERIACLMADIVMARAVNWERIIPVSTLALSRPLLRSLMTGDDEAVLQLQMRLLGRVQETFTFAQDLAKRAAALRKVEPKLRAKTAGDAVELFLTEEAIAPSGMLSPVIKGTRTKMTSRAARRLCDRLVELGVARELTGRPTFRLYGI